MARKKKPVSNSRLHKGGQKMNKENTRPNPRDTQRAINELKGIGAAGRSGIESRGKPVSLDGLSFEEILTALLKIKPKKR